MAKHVKRSVVPIYLIGAVWLGWALVFPLRTPVQYALCAALSFAAFTAGKAFFPDREYRLPGDKEDKPAPAPGQEGKKASPEVEALLKERDKAVTEMRRLNDAIEDPNISARIDHLEEVTAKILDHVAANPSKLPQIRRFLDYYLPTTLKLLNAYDRMSAAGVSGSNIDATKRKIEGMMDTITAAFDKQMDALFREEALDISTDITVMENLLAQEGLAGMGPGSPEQEGGDGIRLEL